MDELYSTIRTVYRNHETIRRQYEAMESGLRDNLAKISTPTEEGERAGHVITVYSPSGGCGTTTVATSLASGLMKEGIKVLLIDSDLQFADVGTFLNLQSQSTIIEVAEDAGDLDVELFENSLTTHDSGLKVLMGPARPEFADNLFPHPEIVASIISQVRSEYDFVVVDTGTRIDETLVHILEISTAILLTGTPTLVSIKNMRFVLDLFDQLEFPPERTLIVLNRIWEDRKGKSATVPTEKVESYLKRPVVGKIPTVDERIMLSSINRGVPVIASDRNQEKPPIKQLVELADDVFNRLMGDEEDDEEDADTSSSKKRGVIGNLLSR
jgi:pilus assembly protein CpaE